MNYECDTERTRDTAHLIQGAMNWELRAIDTIFGVIIASNSQPELHYDKLKQTL